MNRRTPARLGVRRRLVAAGIAPLLVAGGFLVSWVTGSTAPPDEAALARRSTELAAWFEREIERARAVAAGALGASAPSPTSRRTGIVGRLEGVGTVDGAGNYLSWHGTPPEPEITRGAPDVQVRSMGVHTRLLVRAGPDAEGRLALASFLLDSRLDALRFDRLVPRKLFRGIDLQVDFAAPPPDGALALGPADVPALGHARLAAVSRGHAAARQRDLALAWIVVTALLALSVAFRRELRPDSTRGLVGTIGLVVLGRLALGTTRAAGLLLPGGLGDARIFGTPAAWRLATSPGDLLLTALAGYLAAAALRRWIRDTGRRARRLAALSAACAGVAVAAAGWLVVQLSRNATVPLLDADRFWDLQGRMWLAVALALILFAAAELAVLTVALVRPDRLGFGGSRPRIAAGVVFFALVIGAGLTVEHLDHRAALGRLRSDYAPLALDRGARRVALSATLDRIAASFAHDGPPLVPDARHGFLAYELWIESELFAGGYKSSLDFYDPGGGLVSRFGFDLPFLSETASPPRTSAVRIVEEPFRPVAAVEHRLLHGSVTLQSAGRPLGYVVGHVLDEPGNLPFLPASLPYLAALGPGAPFGGDALQGGPEYVLYDAPGTVLLTTIAQPPAMTDVLVQAFARRGSVAVEAGGQRWAGLAVQDEDHLLHVLLIPVPTLLERLAASVRLALVAALLLVLLRLVPALLRPRRLLEMTRGLRASLQRKLVAGLLVASLAPLVGLALFVRGFIENRGQLAVVESAATLARSAQRVLDDYLAVERAARGPGAPLNDEIVSWLHTLIGQEIHVYENGLLQATSRRELFTSGLLAPRLDGEVQRRLGREGAPYLVLPSRLGSEPVPVAYAPVNDPDPLRALVAAVPVPTQGRTVARAVQRIAEMILLATVLLAGLLLLVATYVGRSVARPVRELVGATGRIAAGDYATRLATRSRDEIAALVRGFNSMATSLAAQRADLEGRREYIERLLEHATPGVVSVDARGAVVTVNPAARRLLGGPRLPPVRGEALAEAVARDPELEPLGRLLARAPRSPGRPEEVDLWRDGVARRLRVVRVELSGPGNDATGQLILVDDVTDLMRSNQLEAWAEMARAIAHEIKNPLTPIQLSTEHLERLLRDRALLPATDLEACLDTIKKQVRTLYDIAREFSAYAKLPDLTPRPTDPGEFLREVAAPYRAATLGRIVLEEQYAPTDPVAIDTKVLGRALVNLIENAIQAMPDGGRLTLAVGPHAQGREVVIRVEDTGTGLEPEARRRLFEPYFSTKSAGTGLGLAIVRRAVEAHRGRIDVVSQEGRGTTFSIRLPCIVPTASRSE